MMTMSELKAAEQKAKEEILIEEYSNNNDKLIDDRSKIIVCGFIRACERLLLLSIAPEIIFLICSLFSPIPTKIMLKYHSHKGHASGMRDCQPWGIILDENTSTLYCSLRNYQWSDDEPDWIIFEFAENKFYLPKIFLFKNGSSTQSVKEMNISIGDVDANKWYTFNPNPINAEKQFFACPQVFSIYGLDCKLIQNNNLKFIKITFIKNHGYTEYAGPRYVCKLFSLFGSEW
eukprot:435909_1